jgi:exosortase/archaeosortase family protein
MVKEMHVRMRESMIFLAKLIVLALPLYLILWFSVDMSWAQLIVADHSSLIMRLVGMDVSQRGTLLELEHISLNIDRDCTGWKAMLFFLALIIATPGRSKRRMVVGILVGLLIIYFLNILRIVTIAAVGEVYGVETFSLVHTWFWQPSIILAVIGIWVLWLRMHF